MTEDPPELPGPAEVPDPAAWIRLGRIIRRRRNILGLTQNAGGVSPATWRKIESAKSPPYRPSSVAAVCRVLGWAPESFDRILEGGDPIEIGEGASSQSSLAGRLMALEAEIGTLKERVGSLADDVGWIKVELKGGGTNGHRDET